MMSTDPAVNSSRYNPYAAPAVTDRVRVADVESSALDLFWSWEKLRVIYNGILFIEVALLLSMTGSKTFSISDLLMLIFFAVAANVCFCAGPVLNGYAIWMGFRGRGVTWLLFLAGTGLAVVLAFGSLYGINMRNF
jgi:hypothetical protein